MLIVPHLILKKGNKILLTRRAPTQKIWANHWHCVTGGIEEGESPMDAIIREAEEEVKIKVKNINLVTVISLTEKDFFDPTKKFYGLELFFLTELDDEQTPINAEPLKQDAIGWFDHDAMPKPMIPGVEFGIKSYFSGINYAEFRNT